VVGVGLMEVDGDALEVCGVDVEVLAAILSGIKRAAASGSCWESRVPFALLLVAAMGFILSFRCLY
jgi:hypothetical protein